MNNRFYDSIEYDLSHNLICQQHLENYDIGEEIYRSSNSHIFLITDKTTLEKKVLKAIRLQDGISYDVFTIMGMEHPALVTIYEHFYSDVFLYLIKEYVEGDDLEQYVKKNGPLDESTSRTLIKQLVNVLDYLHHDYEEVMIYRDLKPSNIVLNKRGQLKLIDLITIRSKKEASGSDTFYIGSHGYAAPEQYGFMQSTEKADIYALGACLYFLVTGEHPKNDMHFKDQVEKDDDLSNGMKKVIVTATSFSPNERYASIIELESDLDFDGKSRIRIRMDKFSLLTLTAAGVIALLLIVNGLTNVFTSITESQAQVSDELENSSGSATAEENSTDTDNQEAQETETPSGETGTPTESIEEKGDVESLLLNGNEIVNMTSGLNFNLLPGNIMEITVDRENLPLEVHDFTYISVGSNWENYKPEHLEELIYGAAVQGYGIEIYNGGFNSVLEDRQNLAILLYDDQKVPLGFHFYNDIETHTMTNNDTSTLPASNEDGTIAVINPLDIPELTSGFIFTLSPDNHMNIQVDRQTLPDYAREFIKISVTSEETAFEPVDLADLYYGAAVQGHGLQVFDNRFTSVLEDRNNIAILIYDERNIPLGYYFYNNIDINPWSPPEEDAFPSVGRWLIDSYLEAEFLDTHVTFNVLPGNDYDKMAIHVIDAPLTDELEESLRELSRRGTNTYDYDPNGITIDFAQHGLEGYFLEHNWMVFLLNEDMKIIKQSKIERLR